jgi:hypothetical protein
MINKTSRSAIKIFLFVVMALVGPIFPDIANSQSIFRGTVTLPYEVRWGQAMLQPGDYLILFSSLSQPAQIYSENGKQMFFTSAQFTELNSKGKNCLIVAPDGDKHVVYSLNMPRFGVSLIYKPIAKIQRENTAKASHAQDLVAVAASK